MELRDLPVQSSPPVQGEWRESIAKGGPREGIKVGAPSTWDGRIAKPGSPIGVEGTLKQYPGRYVWIRKAWVWVVQEPGPAQRATAGPRKYVRD
jgi:hypothetical protein